MKFEPKTLDFTLSPYTGLTRESWLEAGRYMLEGIFQNINGTVTSTISKDAFYFAKSEKFVNENYKGSIPSFLAAFTSRNKLSPKDIGEIQKMIDKIREG